MIQNEIFEIINEMKSLRQNSEREFHELFVPVKKWLKIKTLVWTCHTLRQGRPIDVTLLLNQ